MNTDVDLLMASLARQRSGVLALPLALRLPYRVRGQGGTVGQKFPPSRKWSDNITEFNNKKYPYSEIKNKVGIVGFGAIKKQQVFTQIPIIY